MSSIPGGRYHMNLDMLEETTSLSNYLTKPIKFTVKHHVPTYGNLMWMLFFISIIPGIIWIQKAHFESKRNENRYYPLEDTEK